MLVVRELIQMLTSSVRLLRFSVSYRIVHRLLAALA